MSGRGTQIQIEHSPSMKRGTLMMAMGRGGAAGQAGRSWQPRGASFIVRGSGRLFTTAAGTEGSSGATGQKYEFINVRATFIWICFSALVRQEDHLG